MAASAIRSDLVVNTRTLRAWVCAALLAVVILVGAFNVLSLNEAFGDGPPYYAQTTNMDKWTDPLPMLVIVDAFTVLLVASTLYLARPKC